MKSVDELISECVIEGVGLKPHPGQSIARIPELVLDCWRNPSGVFRLGRRETVLVIGVDGLSFSAAQDEWTSDFMAPLTSVFPTTTTVGWMSALTGLKTHEHGLPGVVFQENQNLVNALQDTFDTGAPTTMFELARRLGVQPTVLLGDLEPIPRSWRDAITNGAVTKQSAASWADIRSSPEEMTPALIADVNAALAETQKPSLLWAHFHLDPYIHESGYDNRSSQTLKALDQAAREWTKQGITVVAHSDHGMTQSRPDPNLVDKWKRLSGSKNCELPPGGAGRTLWCYPRNEVRTEVSDQVKEALGASAFVGTAEDVAQLGLWGLSGVLKRRVGGVVAIARDATFPAPSDHRWEHGAATIEEMLVPLAVWNE